MTVTGANTSPDIPAACRPRDSHLYKDVRLRINCASSSRGAQCLNAKDCIIWSISVSLIPRNCSAKSGKSNCGIEASQIAPGSSNFNRSRSACWILHSQKFSGLFLESNVR